MNLSDVVRDFHDEESCIAFLESQRWPKGVECVQCHSKRITKTIAKGRLRDGKRGPDRRLYECSDCRKQFSVQNGTLFGDSHVPLTKWFQAIAVICQAKKGVSANQIGRTIGVTTKTAWFLCHRIREAMNTGDLPLLKGTVEVDETYVGGKQRKGEMRQTWYERKLPVMGMKERGGLVRFRQVRATNAGTVRQVVSKHVSPDAERIITDESVIYHFGLTPEQRAKHFTVNHSITYVNGEIHTNGVEGSFSLFKRALVGSYHRMSVKHLDRYLREFEFKQNNRKNPAIFQQVLTNVAAKPQLTLRVLVDGAE
jgi:transposase-like protein